MIFEDYLKTPCDLPALLRHSHDRLSRNFFMNIVMSNHMIFVINNL